MPSSSSPPTEVIMKIIELGGHYLVMPKKSMKMIELGGPELVIVKNKDGFTPLIAVPFALSAILPLNFKNIKILTKEIELRKSKI